MATAELIALLVKAAIDAIVAAVQAGQSREVILKKIHHIRDDARVIEADVDAMAQGR